MSHAEPDGRQVRAILLFHGWGGTGEELARALDVWTRRWPGMRLVGLEAPNAQDGGGAARQWFSRIGIDAGNRAARIAGARAGVDAAVHGALQALSLDESQTAWLGFSQGAMVLLDAITQGRFSPRAAIAIAGRLVVPPCARVDTDILLLHGERDDVVPLTSANAADAALRQHGYATSLVTFPAVGHQLTRDVVEQAARFLDPRVAPTNLGAGP